MRRKPSSSLHHLALLVLALTASAHDQDAPPSIEPTPLALDAPIKAVTVYRGRAAVTRSAALSLAPGLYELTLRPLPQSIQPGSLQARVEGPAKVLGVDYAEKPVAAAASQQLAQLDAQIEDVQNQLREIGDQEALLKGQEELIAAVGVRAAGDATKEAGTPQLDLEVLRKELSFVSEERGKVAAAKRALDAKGRDAQKQLAVLQAKRQQMGAGSGVERSAVVTLAVTGSGPATVDLVYLVANAAWEPAYNVRGDALGSLVLIEYDALLAQQSGEDWQEVRMTLSTAQPALAANPPALSPWYVEAAPQVEMRRADKALIDQRAKAMEGRPAYAGQPPGDPATAALEMMAADAAVGGTGPAVSFELPRAVTVQTSSGRQQRTRIGSFRTDARFIHHAVPLLTPAIYIRGEITNSSPYQVLPGPASIFVGQDYVGPTQLPAVAPGGQFKVHFGIDPAVKATRQLVTKKTDNSGLFEGRLKTTYDFRIEVDNGTGKAITLELWDRVPVSRVGDCKIELQDLSQPLASDTEYVQEQKPQGLLKWALTIPAGASGKSAFAVTYRLVVNRPKNLALTLPE